MNEEVLHLVTATAEAVEQLSKLVAGMPKAVDAKLDELRGEITRSLSTFAAQVNELRSDYEAMRGSLQAVSEGSASALTETETTMRQVIADNGAALAQRIEELDGKLGVLREEIGADIARECGAVRAACDTVDLHHSVKLLGVTVDELRGEVVKKAPDESVTALLAEKDERINGIAAALEDLNSRVTKLDDSTVETIGEIRLSISVGTEAANTRNEDLSKRVTACESILGDIQVSSTETAGSLIELREVVVPSLRDEFAVNINAAVAQFVKAEAVQQEILAAIEPIKQKLTSLEWTTQEIESVSQSVTELREVCLPNAVGALRSEIATTAEPLMKAEAVKQYVTLAVTPIKELATELTSAVDKLNVGMLELQASTGVRLAAATEAANTFEGEIRELVKAEIATAATRTLENVASLVEQTTTKVTDEISSVKEHGLSLSEYVKSLPTMEEVTDAIEKRQPTPPVPFDPTELEERLVSKLTALVPEQATLEIPAPEFSLMFEGDTLVVKAKWGEDEVTATREISVGFAYRGIFRSGEKYSVGNFVTHKGSIWYAKAVPTGEPGKDITGWQLAVKCGRDGRDATPTRAYVGTDPGRLYREADFLRLNNRLWQCAVKETTLTPEPGDISSTKEWTLIGGVH